jgi:hypothetical protein
MKLMQGPLVTQQRYRYRKQTLHRWFQMKLLQEQPL